MYFVDGTQASTCGLYAITSSETWLEPVLDDTDSSQVQLTIDVSDESLAGIYDLTLTIGMLNYPSVTAKTTGAFKATLYKIDQ